MSRWSDQFQNHQIHETLRQSIEWLNTKVKIIDEEIETEKRRLFKVLTALNDIISGLDYEIVPISPLNQINAHLRNAQFWNHLQAYGGNPSLQYLQIANNHIDAILPAVFDLRKFGNAPEQQAAIKSAEQAFDGFSKVIAERETDHATNLANNEKRLSEFDARLATLDASAGELKSSTESRLSEWQSEFTKDQTQRAELYSDAVIKRTNDFDETLKELRGKSETELSDLSATHTASLMSIFTKFSGDAETRKADIEAKHASILDIHELVATDGVAGGYKKSADDEHKAANKWRRVAMAFLALAAGWIVAKYFWRFSVTDAGGLNWVEVVTAVSLTLIFLATAGYASRQSKLHREAEQQMRWFALEVKAIDPFISSLPPESQHELKKQLSERLFGQNRNSSNQKNAGVDPDSVKSIAEAFASPMTELAKAAVKQ